MAGGYVVCYDVDKREHLGGAFAKRSEHRTDVTATVRSHRS